MKDLLYKMFEHKNLSREDAKEILLNISEGKYNDSQLAAFMTVFLMRSITTDELEGFREALLERRIVIDLDGSKEAIDIVGTGGDGKNTFNISTAACFVVAGAGYKVIKHGNYGASSVSGASNVLELHGVKFTAEKDALQRSLDESGMAYLHAPFFSPALKSVGGVRRALGVRTFFNMLGPMVNPVIPQYQLLGVYNLKLARLYNYMYQKSGINYTIVNSLDGYDEVSLTSPFKVINNKGEYIYTPEEVGFNTYAQDELWGGETVEEAAAIFDKVIAGKGSDGQMNSVIVNAAFAINTIQPEITLEAAIEKAKDSIYSGKAQQTFLKFIELNS